MNPRFEKVPVAHGRSFACLEFKERVFDCPYHFHPEIEITQIVESYGTVMIGSGLRRFESGDIYLIGASVPHAFHNSPDWRKTGRTARSRVIQFRLDCFGEIFFNLPELRSVATLLANSGKGILFGGALRLELECKLKATMDATGAARIVHLLDLLQLAAKAKARDLEFVAESTRVGVMSAADERRMQRVLDFLHANLVRNLTVDEVAAVAHLAPGSFCRFFKRTTKQTFVRFVNAMRVNLACERLAGTDEKITEIAFAVGFGNLPNFNRRFLERRGQTPSAYRRECREVVCD
jgi:AraC-like DNA-binding protein